MARFKSDSKLALMSDATAARLGECAPMLAENTKLKIIIALSSSDCFASQADEDAFYDGGISAESVSASAGHFSKRLAEIDPALADLGNSYRELIFKHLMMDAPMALPILPAEGEPIQVGFLTLGRNHSSGRTLAEKLSHCKLPEDAVIPEHAALERIALFHELDHLRPEDPEHGHAGGAHLLEETGRDHFSLGLLKDKGLVTDADRQAFVDYRLLGGIHGSDAGHRTGVGLAVLGLDKPLPESAELWDSLNQVGEDIFKGARPDNISNSLSQLFAGSAEISKLAALLQVAPLKYEDGRKAVADMLGETDPESDPTKFQVLKASADVYARMDAPAPAPAQRLDVERSVQHAGQAL